MLPATVNNTRYSCLRPSTARCPQGELGPVPPGNPGRPHGSHSPAVPQVVVGLVQPVFARGVEDVQVDGVLESPGLVWHVRWYAQYLTGAYHDFFPINGELHCAFKDICDLLVVMVVLRYVC